MSYFISSRTCQFCRDDRKLFTELSCGCECCFACINRIEICPKCNKPNIDDDRPIAVICGDSRSKSYRL